MPSQVFDYTGEWQKFNVPAGVSILSVVLEGGGASTGRATPRAASRVTGNMRVSDKQTLFILVGRRGIQASGRLGGDIATGGGGAGGDGGTGHSGGDGGGGASAIRLNSKAGMIRAVAGGAGGNSGDAGLGGRGGPQTGENGSPGTSGSEPTSNSTGGTQAQGGKGGTSGAGTAFYGHDAANDRLGRGGRGGSPDQLSNVHGGGGGGGGFYPGGGGQAASIGHTPGGGGAGGSSFVGGLYGQSIERGGGGTDHGHVTITWTNPDADPPPPPENIVIEGHPITNNLATKAIRTVTLKGTPNDGIAGAAGKGVRLLVWVSRTSGMARHSEHHGTYDPAQQRDIVEIDNLDRNTHYYVRIYTQDKNGRRSINYRATNFWTNRPPNGPTLTGPTENQQVSALDNVTFTWSHNDPDPSDGQSAFELHWRRARTPLTEPGEWSTTGKHSVGTATWTIDAGTFKGNTLYEWTARTWDAEGDRGEWAEPKSFYVTADTTPPVLINPHNNEAIVATDVNRFRWRWLNPNPANVQARADLRFRVVGTPDFTVLTGDTVIPGDDQFWDVDSDTFTAGYRYEWQARTYTESGSDSEWSESDYFWATVAPGSGAGVDVVASGEPQAPLGQGHTEWWIYQRGGEVSTGPVGRVSLSQWGRVRDEISHTTLRCTPADQETCDMLAQIGPWRHELVGFRDNGSGLIERVWEGPITRSEDQPGYFEIEAWDVMAYVYRRIMRQGYNDAYRLVNGEQLGLHTVVQRAQQIVMNALAYDDPNVLPYLTPLDAYADARQSRVVKDFAKTAWEEIDDMAAHAGLDYTAIGRRILLWDTHRPVGRLPEMGTGDFSNEPIISHYGMSAANFFAVTNNNGIWGDAQRGLDVDGQPGPEGWVEQLASTYSESEGAGDERTLTQAAKQRLIESMTDQAERSIGHRWPPPKVVRVPDNSTLNPELNLGINQLIPGVWIPLRVKGRVQELAQWQKLDSVLVTEAEGKAEQIQVTLGQAPNSGQDPDADEALEETQ